MNNFKVGDWIRNGNRIFKYSYSDLEYDKKNPYHGKNDIIWSPEAEEVCIFWNEEKGIKVISRFYAFEHDGFTEAIEFKNYKFCAPYINNI